MSIFSDASKMISNAFSATNRAMSAIEKTAGIADKWAEYGELKADLSIKLATLNGAGVYAEREAEINKLFPPVPAPSTDSKDSK